MTRKIVIFTSEFPYGNQETFLETELAYLEREFDEVVLVPLFAGDKARDIPSKILLKEAIFSSREISKGWLNHILSPLFWRALCTYLSESLLSTKKNFKQALIVSAMKDYLDHSRQILDSDLWYFYWGTNSVSILPFLSEYPRSVARFHRYDLYGTDIEGGEYQPRQKQVVQSLSDIICISDHGKCYLEDRYPNIPVSVFRLGVKDRGNGHFSEDGVFRIVSCSNLFPVKRVELIAKALSQIDDIPIEWTHIGDGREDIREKILNLELPSQVKFKFTGQKTNAEVMVYYKVHPVDLFLNVSLSEGAPVSIMEAMSFGIPVMATDVGGTKELLLKESDCLLPMKLNSLQLAEKIRIFYQKWSQSIELREKSKHKFYELANADINYKLFAEHLSSSVGAIGP